MITDVADSAHIPRSCYAMTLHLSYHVSHSFLLLNQTVVTACMQNMYEAIACMACQDDLELPSLHTWH